ncbi:hypothetical protein LTR66_017036, partial [Elasticomyces elasticus]
MSKTQRQHVRQCGACQQEQQQHGLLERVFKRRKTARSPYNDIEAGPLDDAQLVTGVDGAAEEKRGSDSADYVATISITGMTCASCAKSISDQVGQLAFVNSVEVNLLGNNAKIKFRGQEEDATLVVEAIEEAGFDGILDHIARIGNAQSSTVKVAIIGIAASLVRVKDEKESSTAHSNIREVEFEIEGMYCSLCPGRISESIQTTFGSQVTVLSQPSLKLPRIKIEYTPLPPKLTIRCIKAAIEAADPAIIAAPYQAPSMEERSSAIHHRESTRILRHLVFSFVAAIPSLIIGIVYMSLVSIHNPTRQWFETPIWAGNAIRSDWAMFILTTPVMFYGAGIFHTRALREIWSIWRPKSKVPILKRFYRFGSMNLLISAGTSVAYFSSLAILIMEATSPRMTGMSRRSSTYFDTVTFLTFFILIGKFLQAYSKSRTGDAVAMLGDLRPTHASLVEPLGDGQKTQTKNMPINLLEVGDIVSVPHGASPPVDGIVIQEGVFLFDESSLTGESRPVKKTKGDTILTGSVNQSDPCRIEVKELGGTSMLDQIISVVREGQAKRAPVERFADIITSYFTPVITYTAIVTW